MDVLLLWVLCVVR